MTCSYSWYRDGVMNSCTLHAHPYSEPHETAEGTKFLCLHGCNLCDRKMPCGEVRYDSDEDAFRCVNSDECAQVAYDFRETLARVLNFRR